MKTATLTPGRWVYHCPCGYVSCSGIVFRRDPKWLLWCPSCRQWGGKYEKVMEERLEFGSNPNNVLNCEYVPMIRLAHPVRNAVGAVKKIYLRGIYKGTAKVVFRDTLPVGKVHSGMTLPACGVSAEEFRIRLKRSCRDKAWINWETQEVDYIVLQYTKESKEPELFQK